MQLNKSYTIVKLMTEIVNEQQIITLSYGSIEGYRDSLCYPEKSFETEEEAVAYMLDNKLWGDYTIIPIYNITY